jgi:hypothetical protein
MQKMAEKMPGGMGGLGDGMPEKFPGLPGLGGLPKDFKKK